MRKFYERHEVGCTVFVLALVGFLIAGFVFWRESHFYYRTETVNIEVTDKEDFIRYVPIRVGKVTVLQPRHHYFFKFDDNILEVDLTDYELTNIGDKITVKRTYKYYKEDDTLKSIYYSYIGKYKTS